MCGICGVVHADRGTVVDAARLRRMRAAIEHRGPDGDGEHFSDGAGLAHARLSVIDVATGQQPLSNEDGSVWITYNGEIYNYAALRERLLDQGHRFRTKSDTEVIVHLYEEMGTELVHELNGMFAFAIHDRRQRRVVGPGAGRVDGRPHRGQPRLAACGATFMLLTHTRQQGHGFARTTALAQFARQ